MRELVSTSTNNLVVCAPFPTKRQAVWNILTAETHIGYRRRLAHGHGTAKCGLRRYVPRLEYARKFRATPDSFPKIRENHSQAEIYPQEDLHLFCQHIKFSQKRTFFQGAKPWKKRPKNGKRTLSLKDEPGLHLFCQHKTYCVDKKDAVNFSRSKTPIFGFFNPKIGVFAFEKLQISRPGSVKFFSRQGRCKWEKQAKTALKGGGES